MSPRCIYLMQRFIFKKIILLNADDDDESGVASFTALPRTQWAKVIAPNTARFKVGVRLHFYFTDSCLYHVSCTCCI